MEKNVAAVQQLHGSSTHSLVQEVNKNSLSARNSRGYLGRENIITQLEPVQNLRTCTPVPAKSARGVCVNPLVSP